MSVPVCSIDEGTNNEIQAFRRTATRSNNARALVLKIDPGTMQLKPDGEVFEDVDLEDLKDELPGHQPR